MFENCHPGPTSRRGRGYRNLGVDRAGDADDAEYVLCAQCGFPCLKTRDARGDSIESPGLEQVTTAVTLQEGGSVDKIEMSVVSGCPFCGSHNYEGSNRLREAGRPRTSVNRR